MCVHAQNSAVLALHGMFFAAAGLQGHAGMGMGGCNVLYVIHNAVSEARKSKQHCQPASLLVYKHDGSLDTDNSCRLSGKASLRTSPLAFLDESLNAAPAAADKQLAASLEAKPQMGHCTETTHLHLSAIYPKSH